MKAINMPVKRSRIATAVLLFVATGLAPLHAQDIESGEKLLNDNCSRCHAIDKDAKSTHPEAPAFAEVVTRYPPSSLAEALAEGISTGHPDMPEFVFTPEQITDLIAYLETLQQ